MLGLNTASMTVGALDANLQVLDGSDTKGKHMILFTCNDDSEIDVYKRQTYVSG